MTTNQDYFLWDHPWMYHLQLNLLVQLDPQYLWLNLHCIKRDYSVSHYARDEEHQDTKDESLTAQSEDKQKARMSVETTMASTTSPMRMAPPLRQPEQTTGRPAVTPRSTIP